MYGHQSDELGSKWAALDQCVPRFHTFHTHMIMRLLPVCEVCGKCVSMPTFTRVLCESVHLRAGTTQVTYTRPTTSQGRWWTGWLKRPLKNTGCSSLTRVRVSQVLFYHPERLTVHGWQRNLPNHRLSLEWAQLSLALVCAASLFAHPKLQATCSVIACGILIRAFHALLYTCYSASGQVLMVIFLILRAPEDCWPKNGVLSYCVPTFDAPYNSTLIALYV